MRGIRRLTRELYNRAEAEKGLPARTSAWPERLLPGRSFVGETNAPNLFTSTLRDCDRVRVDYLIQITKDFHDGSGA